MCECLYLYLYTCLFTIHVCGCVRVSAYVWDVQWRCSCSCAGHDDLQGWRRICGRSQRRRNGRTGLLVDAHPCLPRAALRWLLRLDLLLVLVLPAFQHHIISNVYKYINIYICICTHVSSPFTYVVVCVFLRLCGTCRGVICGCLQGKLTYANGDVYEGEWEDQKKHGQVRWLTPNPFCRTRHCAGVCGLLCCWCWRCLRLAPHYM